MREARRKKIDPTRVVRMPLMKARKRDQFKPSSLRTTCENSGYEPATRVAMALAVAHMIAAMMI